MITGTGRAACHHGEILQGVFLDGRGRHRRGLVTLPMAEPVTEAVFEARPGYAPDRVETDPPGRIKAARAAALAVAECAAAAHVPACGGVLRLRGGAPAGLGMGSSTSDVTAAVRAVCAGYGTEPDPGAVARIAVAAEGASDPIMLGERALLFAQREGRVLEDLGAPLPPMTAVGCLTGGGRPVDTLTLGGRPHPADTALYEELRADLRAAVAAGDAAGVGRVATESAVLNQRVLPKAELGTLRGVARLCGAVGVQIAHSGNVAGVLFDSRDPDLRARTEAARAQLRREGLTPTRVFSTPRRTDGERTWTTTCARPLADLI
ncbi:GHMP kinase [Nocardiopsis algeriensis]|uniref:GHMP family kinase ATP-binding protein n=1 Tax=Nocardiopsis algeriensis TaxID=1478215 RepID=UPI003B43A373